MIRQLGLLVVTVTLASSAAMAQRGRVESMEKSREARERTARETLEARERSDAMRNMNLRIRIEREASELVVLADRQAKQGTCSVSCLESATALLTIAKNQSKSGLDVTNKDEKVIRDAHRLAFKENLPAEQALDRAFAENRADKEKAINCGKRLR
jgi:hypothetical protein